MRRLVVAVSVFVLWVVQAEALYFRHCNSGEYVAYIDERGPSACYRTYLLVRSEEGAYLFVRTRDLATGQESRFRVALKESESATPAVGEVKHLSGESTDMHLRATRDLQYLFSVSARYGTPTNTLQEPQEFDDPLPEFGYTMRVRMNSYLPLFGVERFGKVGGPPVYFVDRAGILAAKQLDQFWQLKPWRPDELRDFDKQLKLEPTGIPFSVTVNSFRATLDSNWTRQKTDTYDGYWIAKASTRDAQITVQRAPWPLPGTLGTMDLHDYVRFNLLATAGPKLLPRSVVVTEEQRAVYLQFQVADPDSYVTYYRERFNLIGDTLYVLNFSAWQTVYRDNAAYFERLLLSVAPPER